MWLNLLSKCQICYTILTFDIDCTMCWLDLFIKTKHFKFSNKKKHTQKISTEHTPLWKQENTHKWEAPRNVRNIVKINKYFKSRCKFHWTLFFQLTICKTNSSLPLNIVQTSWNGMTLRWMASIRSNLRTCRTCRYWVQLHCRPEMKKNNMILVNITNVWILCSDML